MRIKKIALILVSLIGITNVQAHTSSEENFICPIGGKKFSQLMDSSGTSFGQMLDLKPIGPISAPWSLAVCPDNQFVMYKDKFTDDEIKTLTAYVQSAEYQKIINEETYYRAAQLKRVVNESTGDIALTLLEATWQSPTLPYLQEALDEYKKYLQQLKHDKKTDEFTNNESWINAELITLELERRTGQFDAAEQRLKKLSDIESFNDDSKIYKQILNLQKKLIDQKDKNQHQIPTGKK